MKDLFLSATGIKRFWECPYKYSIGRDYCLPATPSQAFGTAFHTALEKGNTDSFLSLGNYDRVLATGTYNSVSRTVLGSLPSEPVAREAEFSFCLVSPSTGRRSHTILTGRIDLFDGQTPYEFKTTRMSGQLGSAYWQRVQVDIQPAIYCMATGSSRVRYIVIQIPDIEPKLATPPDKVRYKADGTLYAYVREKDETEEEYSARVAEALSGKNCVEFYDVCPNIHKASESILLTATMIRAIDNSKKREYVRFLSSCVKYGRCELFDHCHNGEPLTGLERRSHAVRESVPRKAQLAIPGLPVRAGKSGQVDMGKPDPVADFLMR